MLTTGNIKVAWHYSSDEVPFFSTNVIKVPKLSVRDKIVKTTSRKRNITTCVVTVDDIIVASASVVRGWNDKQCYEVARKLSLKRATECAAPNESGQISALNKEQRQAIWEAYRTNTKVPRWNVTKK